MRFEVFMVVKIQVEVSWVVTACSVAVGYQCFRGPCYLHLQDEVNGAGEKGIDIGLEYKRGVQHSNLLEVGRDINNNNTSSKRGGVASWYI
jgi:hypothetical protein